MDAEPLASERGTERREDDGEARACTCREEPVCEAVESAELAAGRGVGLRPVTSATTSSGRDPALARSATSLPWPRTTMRSVSRNI